MMTIEERVQIIIERIAELIEQGEDMAAALAVIFGGETDD